jgi:hypothetical protein
MSWRVHYTWEGMETLYNGRKQVAKNSMVWDKRNKGSTREGCGI